MNNACVKIASDGMGVRLHLNPAFIPKEVGPCIPIKLKAFNPSLFTSAEQEGLHTLCPDWALRIYQKSESETDLLSRWILHQRGISLGE